MVRRHELTEQAWAQIQPLLPPTATASSWWPSRACKRDFDLHLTRSDYRRVEG